MTKSEVLSIDAVVDNVDIVREFTARLLAGVDSPEEAQLGLDLAVEEIFANIANYAYYPQTGKVTIHGCLTRECCKITLSFEDSGKPFNPLEKMDPNLDRINGKRQIGGLGIFLTRKMVDDIQYEYRDGKNILTLYKYMTGETPYPR